MRWSWVLLFAFACTGTTIEDSGSSVQDSDSDTGESVPVCDSASVDSGVGGSASLTGIITDSSGAPVGGAEIGLCKSVCRTLCTAADGSFTYEAQAADTYSFHVRPPHDRDDLIEVDWPIVITDSDALTQNVQLVDVPTTTVLPTTSTELEVATGLHITVAQGDLKILFEDDPTEIGAVAIPTAFFPTPTGAYVGGWFMEPYNAKADPGLAVRFANSFGLASGAQVHVYAASYDDFMWLDMGTFTESGGFFVADNATTGGLPVLATLVLMDES